tara:strand:+ start:650 stop:763 length:114 start_codon:yes stop_codon:yes gene_type:complete
MRVSKEEKLFLYLKKESGSDKGLELIFKEMIDEMKEQ